MTRTLDLAAATAAATAAAAKAAGATPAGATPAAAVAADGAQRRRCQEVCARVFEYLDGELAPPLAAAVRAHLVACVGCRRRVARDRELLEVIARAARACCDDAAPLSLRVRIHRALTRAEQARDAARRGSTSPHHEA